MRHTFIELAKKNPLLKKLGKKALKVREAYFRLITDEEFFLEYQKKFLMLPDSRDGKMALADQYRKGNITIITTPLIVYYERLWRTISEMVEKKESYTIIRVGDGEANFLRGVIKGNTKSRHYTSDSAPDKKYLAQFKDGLLACDSLHVEMYKSVQGAFNGIYKNLVFSEIPLECIYALVASRKIFKSNYTIGIIGADNKIAIIQQLFNHEEYRHYIGRDSFDDYISVPERGSSNDVTALTQHIVDNLNPNVDIYLIGVGVAKMAIMQHLKEKSNAVFIDVGCGISALAGLVSNDRPYFADWINFRLKGFDYSTVDAVDADMHQGGKMYV